MMTNEGTLVRWSTAFWTVAAVVVLVPGATAQSGDGGCDPQRFYVDELFAFPEIPDFELIELENSGIVIDTFTKTHAYFRFVGWSGADFLFRVTGRLGDMCP